MDVHDMIAEHAMHAIKRGGVEAEPNWKEAYRVLYYEHRSLQEKYGATLVPHSMRPLEPTLPTADKEPTDGLPVA